MSSWRRARQHLPGARDGTRRPRRHPGRPNRTEILFR
jgi:hypothetical protein